MHRWSRWRAVVALLSVVALVSACNGDDGGGKTADPTGGTGSGGTVTPVTDQNGNAVEKAPWTVLVYQDADNNIEADLLADMERMAEVGSNENVNVIVLIDRSADDNSYSPAPGVVRPDGDLLGVPNFDDAKLVKVNQGSMEVIQDVGEVSMADPQTLAWFVYTGMTMFPAEHYSLVLNDHGGGIISMEDDSDPPRTDGTIPLLTLDQVADATKTAMDQAGVERLDFFGYNACLMATYDALAQMAPLARWMTAAEESTLGPQWDFAPMLQTVASNPDATGEDMGRAIVDNVLARVPDYPLATMSLLDLDKMGPLSSAVESLATSLEENMSDVATTLGRARNDTLEFGVQPGNEFASFHMVDLGDLTRRLSSTPPAVQTASGAVYEAISHVAVDVARGPAESEATGISIYFPPTVDHYEAGLGSIYETQPSARAWNSMLRSYFQFAQDVPSDGGGVPTFAGAPTLQVDETGVLAFASLVPGTETSVIEAELLCGRPSPDGFFEILYVAPALIGAGDQYTVAGSWDFSYLQVTDGSLALDATVILDPVADGIQGFIPMVYQAPDGSQAETAFQFTLDASGNLLGLSLIRFEEDGTAAELNPEPGSLLAPLVLVASPGGDVQPQLLSSEGLDATSASLGFQVASLAGGSDFMVALLANDAVGNTAAAVGSGTVP